MSEESTGEQTTSWIPEALTDAPFFRPMEDGSERTVDQVKADLVDLAQHMGNSIRIPGPDAGEADIAKFQERVMEKIPGLMKAPNLADDEGMAQIFGKLGRPEKADDYAVPEGVEMEPADLAKMKDMAHRSNLTQAQFKQYLSGWNENMTAAQQQAQTKLQEGLGELKKEWGAAYDTRSEAIAEFLKSDPTTPPSVLQALESEQLPADQVRWMYSMAEAIGTEGRELSDQRNDPGSLTPREAQAQLLELENRLFDRANPPGAEEAKMLNEKRLELVRSANA